MTKLDAVIALMRAVESKRVSRAAVIRLERACKTLGLSDEEATEALSFIGYDPRLRARLVFFK